MDTPSISVEFSQLLTEWLERENLSAPALHRPVKQAGPRSRIDLSTWKFLLEQAQGLRPGDAVGLQLGSGVGARHVGTLGYLVLNTETLAEALETYHHCEHQFYGVNLAQLQRSNDVWRVYWPIAGDSTLSLVVELAFAALFTFMRQRFGNLCRLRSVEFPETESRSREQYERFFQCEVRFGSQAPGLEFALTPTQQQISVLGTGDFEILREQQDSAFNGVVPANDAFLRQLRRTSLRLLPFGKISLNHVATEMNLSPRTLQRRLARYELHYQELLDGLREQLAARYLTRSSLTLAQLSQLLGYSEQSAFQRAFKHWTGSSPGEYRRLQGLTCDDISRGNAKICRKV